MPKQAVRTLIQLRKQLDTLETDIAENRRQEGLASVAATTQLGLGPGEERQVKFAGEYWRVIRGTEGVRVLPLVVDNDI
jgi:hypothetical protein